MAICIESLEELRRWRRQAGERVGFVPTMGALHAGHISLVEMARRQCERVVVSIFVNPLQFSPNEDLDRYPQTMSEDMAKLSGAGVDAVFAPDASTVYLPGANTLVRNPSLSNQLCGLSRAGHFEGVLTVVLKLFNLVSPTHAFFGKKDYQQLRLIEAMCRDLNLPIEIYGGELIREADGLAMSSRNRYLGESERERSLGIFAGLMSAVELFRTGERSSAELTDVIRQKVLGSQLELEYCEIRRSQDLSHYEGEVDEHAVAFVAAYCGKTRLIDNMELAPPR